MGHGGTDEFRKDAVRMALTRGLTRKQVGDDLGVGMSTLNKWVTAHRDTDVVSNEDLSLAKENDRLRRENRNLKEERDIPNRGGSGKAPVWRFPDEGHGVLREPKAVRFRFVEEHRAQFSTERLCQVTEVSTRGLGVLRSRPASRRQRSDLVTLAHIKEQSRLNLGSHGRPRMTQELKGIGLNVGHRRLGRLMRQNGISVVRTRKHKVTTDSDHKFNIAPDLLDRDFAAGQPNQKSAGDISYVWTR